MKREQLGSLIGPDNNGGTSLGSGILEFDDHKQPKLVKYNNQAFMDSKQRTKSNGENELEKLAYKIGLDSGNPEQRPFTSIQNSNRIKNEAFHYFKKIHRDGYLRGRSTKLGAFVSLFHACRMNGIEITLEQMLEKTNCAIRLKIIKRYYNKLILKGLLEKYFDFKEYANKVLNKLNLNLSLELKTQIFHTIDDFISRGYHIGRNPKLFTVAVIRLVSKQNNQKITQTFLSKISGTSQVNISKTVTYLRNRNNDDAFNDLKGAKLIL